MVACCSCTRTELCAPAPLALANQQPLLRLYSAAVHGLSHESSAIEESDLCKLILSTNAIEVLMKQDITGFYDRYLSKYDF